MKINKNYTVFVKQIKQTIQQARIDVSRSVNKNLIELYWNIGKHITDSQEKYAWGESIVEQLSKDLQRSFKNYDGFSSRNLWFMRQFYVEYKSVKILKQAVSELKLKQAVSELKTFKEFLFRVPWGHHILLMQKIKGLEEKVFYLKASSDLGWSRNVLLNQIKIKAYQRQIKDKKQHNFRTALPVHLAEQAEEALKSSYNLGFLGISKPILERDLESKMVDRIKNVILEFGHGFCFIANQQKMTLGKKDYFVDLLFYHRKLRCLVAIDLKMGEFQPEYAGKMNFYLNLVDEKEKLRHENPSIGIILCADKNNIEVEFALKGIDKPIGVSDYTLTKKLPKRLQGELPDSKELIRKMKKVIA